LPNTGTILIRYTALTEFDPFNSRAITLDHPNAFFAPSISVAFQVCHAANATEQKVIRLPTRNIRRVGASSDVHRITVSDQA
jgi:hypothetical protein